MKKSHQSSTRHTAIQTRNIKCSLSNPLSHRKSWLISLFAVGLVSCVECSRNVEVIPSSIPSIDNGIRLDVSGQMDRVLDGGPTQSGDGGRRSQQFNFDDAPIYIDDDLYAYEDDPDPLRLLPLKSRDVVGFLFASIGITLAAGGGVGGGSIVVPIYILIMGFPPKLATPLSAVTVMGAAIAGTFLNWQRRHPLADRPIIDWDLILVMEPVVLVGTMIGTVFHMILSAEVLVILLVILLSVTAHLTLKKAKRMYDAESVYIERLKTEQSDMIMRHQDHANQPHGINPANINPIRVHPNYILNEQRGKLNAAEKNAILILNPDFVSLRSDMLEEEKVTPRNKIIAICGLFTVLTFLNIMVGGGVVESPWGIDCGGVSYWVVHAIMAACLIASAWAARTYVVNRHKIKEMVHFDYIHGDIKWDSRSTLIYPIFFCSAGVFAGMFGIGGGMVTVPLMLAMGVHPAVATATSGCMTLFTTLASSTSFVMFGLLLWDYAVVCIVIGFFACMFGQRLMQQARLASELGNGRNFERYSIISYCIGGVALLSAILMTIMYVFRNVESDDHGGNNVGICES